jgi:hypothetical protein
MNTRPKPRHCHQLRTWIAHETVRNDSDLEGAFGLLNGKTPTSSQCFTVLYCYGVLEMGSGRTSSISYVDADHAEHPGSNREPARDFRHA